MQEFPPDSRYVSRVKPSPNHGERARGVKIDILLLHYTGMAATARAIERLSEPSARVSSHYVVDERGDILQLVPEARRAWHAGVSSWEGIADINSHSVGIEIGNPGHSFGYPDFPDAQIAAVIALSADIVARHRILPERVLAHSDVAPWRKRDPGEKFPWHRLFEAGIGAWAVAAPPAGDAAALGPGAGSRKVAQLQAALRRYGYAIEETGCYDEDTVTIVTAFQRHYRPARVDGRADRSTIETLQALLAKRDGRQAG
jgi:N-acetylmuramoyl-L-alanine amidase